MQNVSSVEFTVLELDVTENQYQTLGINLTQPSVLMRPDILPHLELPPALDLSREVILFGQAPIWLYGYLIEQCHNAPWIGCYNAPLGAVIVIHSRLSQPKVGDALIPQFNTVPGAAILIGGPPDSGKSLLSSALKHALERLHPTSRLFLHRANWDGQGNWAYESADQSLTNRLVSGFDAKLHWHPEAAKLVPRYFQDQAVAVENLRKVRDLVFVDVGGVPQPEKHPVISACSHYLIISRDPEAIAAWHALCAPSLKCLAVIHSGSDVESNLLSQESPLEFRLGLRAIAEKGMLPEALITAVTQTLENAKD